MICGYREAVPPCDDLLLESICRFLVGMRWIPFRFRVSLVHAPFFRFVFGLAFLGVSIMVIFSILTCCGVNMMYVIGVVHFLCFTWTVNPTLYVPMFWTFLWDRACFIFFMFWFMQHVGW
jgi:hypothetical protein